MANINQKIVSLPARDCTPHPGGLGCAFFEKMIENQDKIAQVDSLTGHYETYKSFLQRCVRTALTMASKGVAQGDIINISSISNMDVCVPYIAALFLGAIPITVDQSLSPENMTRLFGQTKPKIIFAGPEAAEKLEKIVQEASLSAELVMFGNTPNHAPFADFTQPNPKEEEFRPVPAKSLTDTALILFSSGSSGLPKGICLNHYGFLLSCQQSGGFLAVSKVLTFASLNWVSTISILVSCILYGGCRIVSPKFDPSKFWELLDVHKPTLVFLAPIFVAILTKFKRPQSIKELPLKLVAISGGPVSEKHMRNFRKMVPEAIVLLAYAQTELYGAATCFKPYLPEELVWLEKKPTSSGTVQPGFSLKIVDPETEELLGPNQKGELRVKSRIMLNGYYNLDSLDVWDSEGWFKTGDIAYYDEDRCFYIVDRLNEVFKFQSVKVAPAVVEDVIVQHPAVEVAVVLGIPHEVDGNHPMALVILSRSAGKVSPKEIEKFVEERVSDAQRLRAGVKIVEMIPRTSTGKINRKSLRDKVLNGEI